MTTPIDLINSFRFARDMNVVYREYRDSVELYVTLPPGRAIIEAARPSARSWQCLACVEWRDGRRPRKFWLESPNPRGRQRRRTLTDDTELIVIEEVPAP